MARYLNERCQKSMLIKRTCSRKRNMVFAEYRKAEASVLNFVDLR